MGGDDDRLDDLLETLDGLLAETTGKKREHVERARDDVQLQRRALEHSRNYDDLPFSRQIRA
jgi:hypothetical protein